MWPVLGFPRDGRRPRPPKEPDRIETRPSPPGWMDTEQHLWNPVCVNESSYPP